MVRTKQTERKWYDTEMQRAEFPAGPSESEDSSDDSSRAEDTEPREGIEPGAESSETGSREVEPTTSTNQQPSTQIVLPRHTAVSGMDPSFVNYYREHGMTPYLMKSLMTKRGWTLQMVNRVIRNCNAAWKTNVAPVESIRYSDEIDTDKELGPLPRTKDNASIAVTTITSETMYIRGETSEQRGLQSRVETVTKRGRGRGVPIPIARKEPQGSQRGQG